MKLLINLDYVDRERFKKERWDLIDILVKLNALGGEVKCKQVDFNKYFGNKEYYWLIANKIQKLISYGFIDVIPARKKERIIKLTERGREFVKIIQ